MIKVKKLMKKINGYNVEVSAKDLKEEDLDGVFIITTSKRVFKLVERKKK